MKKPFYISEDRLSLAAERTVCSAVGGTFLTSVYTFARFLSSEAGKPQNVLKAEEHHSAAADFCAAFDYGRKLF